MTLLHIWPNRVVVDVADVGGPARFLVTTPGQSGFLWFSGSEISGITTLGAVERVIGISRAPTRAERAAARIGCIFGWSHALAQPTRYEETT